MPQYKNTYISLVAHVTMNTRTKKLLEKTYYNLSNSGAYLGPDKLDRVLKSNSITLIGKTHVRKWLHNQDDYSLRRELIHSFRKARVVVVGIDDQFDMDLTDVSNISNENDSVRYLLFAIDKFSKQENIHYFTTLNSDTKANVAERVIKTAKNMMYRYFITQRTHRCIKVLQEIVKSYNATPRRSLNNIAPKDVNKNNEA